MNQIEQERRLLEKLEKEREQIVIELRRVDYLIHSRTRRIIKLALKGDNNGRSK